MHDNTVDISGLLIGNRYPARVMGVINLSPESFYRGSVQQSVEEVVSTAIQMEKNGADMIDIGGTSTAPKEIYGTQGTSIETELERVKGALQALDGNVSIPISVDTTSAKVAEMALELGADVVNDVTGFQRDAEMIDVIREYSVPAIAMAHCEPHCQTLAASMDALRKSLEIAEQSNVEASQLILDPGVGFGKPTEADLRIIRFLNRFVMLGRPLLVGVSRKAFVGEMLNQERPEDRLVGSLAATAIAVSKGASVIRTHDVRETVMLLRVSNAVRGREELQTERAMLLDVEDESGIEVLLERVGTRSDIRNALAKKGVMLTALLKDITVPGALILKQEILALGGDAAYHHDTIDFERKKTDVLLMGTVLQIGRLSSKIRGMDYFGLPRIGQDLQMLLKQRMKEMCRA